MAYATTSNTVNFQARLQNHAGAIVADGDYNIEFKLYDASSSSGSSQGSCTSDAHCLWAETRTSGNKVTVANGYLTVQLGSVTSFGSTIDWSQKLWLTMNVGGIGSASWDGEMNPRLPLTAVPYAFQAAKAASADQLTKVSGSYTSTLGIQAPTVGNQTFVIQDQGAAGTYNLLTAPSGSDGYIKLQGSTPGTQQTGNFNISGSGIAGTLSAGNGGLTSSGGLKITSGSTPTFTSPRSATSNAQVSIAPYNYSAGDQAIAVGLTSSADSNARGITVFDDRAGVHKPSIAVLSRNESDYVGLSFDGSSTGAYLKTSVDNLTLQVDGVNALTATNSSGDAVIALGTASSSAGVLSFMNATNGNTVSLKSGTTSSSYTLQLPTAIGSNGDCAKITSAGSGVATLGFASCSAGATTAMQDTYDNSGTTNPQIQLNGTNGGLKIRDASSTVGDIFKIQNSAGNSTYFTVTNTGIQTASIDTTAAGTLAIGNSNATTINIGTNAAAHTVNIGTGAAAQVVTVGSTNTTSSLTLQAGSGAVGFVIQGTTSETIDSSGNFTIRPLNNNGSPLYVQNAAGTTSFLRVDGTTGTTFAHDLQVDSGGNLNLSNGAITIGGTQVTTFHTPGTSGTGSNGANVNTKINIPFFDPGASSQIIALGLPSSAASTSRVILAVDARTSAHQPSIAVLSPSEAQVFGLSWDGVSTTPVVKTSTSSIGLKTSGGTTLLLDDGTAGLTQVTIGNSSQTNGAVTLSNSSSNSTVSIISGATSSSYNIKLPTAIGSAGQCLAISSVASTTETLAHSNCFLQGGSSFGATATLGTADSNILNLVTGGTARISIAANGSQITLGTSGGDATGTTLVLGNKTGSATDPTGTNGAMYYNATSNSFRCYENSYWRDCMANARTSYRYTNEMMSNTNDNNLNFTSVGSASSGYVPGEAGHPGIMQLKTGTDTPGTLWSYAGNQGQTSILLGNGDYWRYETALRIPSSSNGLSDGTNRYTIQAGFNDDASGSGTNGCYFKYRDDVNSGKWQGVCRSSSTESTCDATTTVAVDTWYRLTVVVNSAGTSVDFQINGVSKCQVTTNIPTASGHTTVWGNEIIKSAGSSDRWFNIDYIDVQAQFGTAR